MSRKVFKCAACEKVKDSYEIKFYNYDDTCDAPICKSCHDRILNDDLKRIIDLPKIIGRPTSKDGQQTVVSCRVPQHISDKIKKDGGLKKILMYIYK